MFLARSPRLVHSQALIGTPGKASDSDKKDLLGLTVSICHDLAAQLTVVEGSLSGTNQDKQELGITCTDLPLGRHRRRQSATSPEVPLAGEQASTA